MANNSGSSSPLTPRSANLHALVATLQAQVEQLRRANRHDDSSHNGSEEERHEGGGGQRGGGYRGGAHRGRRREDQLEGVKIKIPSFIGKNDPEAYLEWELKIEQLFDCNNYNERKKVKMAAIEFKEYALIWWDQLQKERRRIGDEPVETWDEMKTIMRRRFVPNSYQRDIHNKLQRLTQGDKSVDEYFKEMELALLRSNFQEDRESTMARFLHGLNQEIQDIVELQHYVELEDLVQQAIKVEQQIKRRKSKYSSSKYASSSKFTTSDWKDNRKKEGASTKEAVSTSHGKKAVDSSSVPKTREIKCFKCLGNGHIASQCPTKKIMVIRNGEVESESETSSEEHSEEEMSMPDGDLFMVRRLLGSHVKEDGVDQRENLFHSRCLIQGKVCSLIIDGGSCANIVSARLVSKLNLETKEHPTPYRLQWLSEVGEMLVDKQVEVPFSIGKYEDTIMCDVVPMEAAHMLLGRPWQFDRRASHDGFTNKFSFVHNNRKVVLSSLSPKQVSEDKRKMREKLEKEKKEKEKEKKEKEKEKEKKEKEKNMSEEKSGKMLVVRKVQNGDTPQGHADTICSPMSKIDLQVKEKNNGATRRVDIVPSGPLYTKPNFGSPIPEIEKKGPNGLVKFSIPLDSPSRGMF